MVPLTSRLTIPTIWAPPKTKYVNFLQTQEDDKLNGVITGTVDIADPTFSANTVDAIKKANANDDVNGPKITTIPWITWVTATSA